MRACMCVGCTILPQNDSHIVLRLGADIHQYSWSPGCAETEGYILLSEVHLLCFWLMVQGLCVPADARKCCRRKVVLDQRPHLKETSDIWRRNE